MQHSRHTRRLTRRQALKTFSLQAAGASLVYGLQSTWFTSAAPAADDYEPLNRYPRMVHEYFVKQLRQCEQDHLARLAAVRSESQAHAYVESVRKRIREAFGPEPQRTPLKPRITRTIERDTYRIENVIFESRPGFPVTANLYLPKGHEFPRPAVVGTCGHSTNGKAAEAYQAFAQGLARQGIICLIYDPIGQGERLQYLSTDQSSRIGVGVREHLYAGNQQFLVGEFIGMWRAWDGIRALDYLLTRPEVDHDHVGVTGNSGGGTMTTWLCGLEQRWTMAAPSCFVTTFRRNLENELPADTEQCPPKALALRLDHSDFLVAMGARPVIILAKERDYFDARGAEEAYRRLRHVYEQMGAADDAAIFIGPSTHGYSQENREAMYSWFQRAIGGSETGQPGGEFQGTLRTSADVAFQPEPNVTIEEDETLWCTPQGQVGLQPDVRTVFSFTRERSRELGRSRRSLQGSALQAAVRRVLKLPEAAETVPDYRIWRYLGSRGYPSPHAIAYAVQTEPDIQAICYRLTNERWYSRPPAAGKRAVLYVAHLSSDRELRDEPLIREVMESEPKSPVFTCDVRGIGESMPGTCNPGSFHDPYGNDYFYAIHSLMLDRPYVGQKTWDVLRVVEWLVSLGHTDIHILGKGWGALPATFAALLAASIRQVTLKHALTSYAEIAESEDYSWPLSALLPDVLSHFDLPDCYAGLQNKQLRQIEPWEAVYR